MKMRNLTTLMPGIRRGQHPSRLESRKMWWIFTSVVLGTLMVNIDSSVVNVLIPTLERAFHRPPSSLQWAVSAYLLVVTTLLPLLGSLSDRGSRKNYYLMGVALFTISSALCAVATNLMELIMFRMIQGLGGALIMANVMSIITFTFPPERRGKPLGYVNSIVALGTIIGPGLGSVLLSLFGWRSVFWINIPIGMISLALSIVHLPPLRTSKEKQPLDLVGAIWITAAVAVMFFEFSEAGSWGWTSTPSIVLLVTSVVCFLLFLVHERHTPAPLIQLTYFRIPSFSLSVIASFLSYVLMMMPQFMLPIFLRDVQGESATRVGLVLMTQSLSMFVFSPVAGWLSDRYGPRAWPVIGMAMVGISVAVFSSSSVHTPLAYTTIDLFLFGLGLSLFTAPNNALVLAAVPPQHSGEVGSLLALVRNLGRLVGIAVSSAELNSHVNGSGIATSHIFLVTDFDRAFSIGVILAALAFATSISVSLHRSALGRTF
ncbi:MFS transporter [Alicyclobacillus sendaiensis]|uniref:MFS transporter n=1 Tax=Alicyclobacillus sendaiensis TaxID=192387 RepID=UPI000B077EDA|nr:MFS transporter [Alicyclobacillus sendaiensis]